MDSKKEANKYDKIICLLALNWSISGGWIMSNC